MVQTKTLPRRWQILLAYLGSAAVVMVFLAVLVRINDYDKISSPFAERVMFPAFSDQLNDAARISISSVDESFNLIRQPDGHWVIDIKDDFWADTNYIRQLLLAIRDLKLVEEKSALAEAHSAIGLVSPADKGRAIRLTVYSALNDEPLSDVLIGDRQGRDGRENAFYVRRPLDNQTYLAEGRLELKKNAQDWMDLSVVEIDRTDVKTVRMAPSGTPSYQISRAEAAQPFVLSPIPEGREIKSQYALNSVAYSLVTMNVEDVRNDIPKEVKRLGRFEYELFNGIRIGGDVVSIEGRDWVKFSLLAEGHLDEDDPDFAAAQAVLNRFKARTQGYVFAIPQFKRDQFTRTLEDSLAPIEEAETEPMIEPDALLLDDPEIDLDLEGEELILPDNL